MKFINLPVFKILFLLMPFLILSNGLASTLNQKIDTKKPVKNSTKSKLSTDIQFDGHSVDGKIQNPLEAMSVVENEKSIDDLIGVRKNFSDRSAKAKGMR